MPTKPTTSAKGGPASGGKATKSTAVKKPRAVANKKTTATAAAKEHVAEVMEVKTEVKPVLERKAIGKGRYIFATGRRKTAVANVRLFEGKGDSVVNKKPVAGYFGYTYFQEEIKQPFETTGLLHDYHFTAHVNGGGLHSQAQALRHGISIALGKLAEEVRVVLKKNGLLTRDDRKKERKKPGLKRARRSPQWAKR